MLNGGRKLTFAKPDKRKRIPDACQHVVARLKFFSIIQP